MLSIDAISPSLITERACRYPNPAPYRLPATGQQLFSPPGGGRCAGQFGKFYQVWVPVSIPSSEICCQMKL